MCSYYLSAPSATPRGADGHAQPLPRALGAPPRVAIMLVPSAAHRLPPSPPTAPTPEGTGGLLELDGLVKHYPTPGGEPVRAVDGVSLAVKPGEMVALYGPSGSGKTTLLLMVATLLDPTSGTVSIAGRDCPRCPSARRRSFRLVGAGLHPPELRPAAGRHAIDNAVLKLLKDMRWRDAHRQITPLLERLGLGERLSHRAETLSMGEKQRVMIARALSTEPSLLLADEPTGSLDSQRSREVLELLRELCRERGVAVVLVSHDPLAAGYADRVFALRDGKLSDYAARLRLWKCAAPVPGACLRARAVQESSRSWGSRLGWRCCSPRRSQARAFRARWRSSRTASPAARSLQVLARDPHGMPESAARRGSRQVVGVRVAAPLLEASADATGPQGSRSVELVGADSRLRTLGGAWCATQNWNRSRTSARCCCRLRSPRPRGHASSGGSDAAAIRQDRARAAV